MYTEDAQRPVTGKDGDMTCPNCGSWLAETLGIDCVEHVLYRARPSRGANAAAIGIGGDHDHADDTAVSETPYCRQCDQSLDMPVIWD